ncbi:BrnT family toxin [Azohydromonas lata]|uniref:BrnT family toxin n=1 Tax=Azohydromonas lata TaxID=45677 RepID=UPI000A6F3A10|nr:BrnT family toxin [Azohydromonas lata]
MVWTSRTPSPCSTPATELDVLTQRHGETRVQSFSYVMGRLSVLTVVHVERSEELRIISFRPASREESEVYYEWLSEED